MENTTISFETKPLNECRELTKQIDELCFPGEMWLTPAEWTTLADARAEATIVTRNREIIGQAITLPEKYVEESLQQVDLHFRARTNGVYSYSEAIIPKYQQQGYGSLLLAEIAIRMRERGYSCISAHVRARFGWNRKRSQVLSVSTKRSIYNFWEDPHEIVEYQSAHLHH